MATFAIRGQQLLGGLSGDECLSAIEPVCYNGVEKKRHNGRTDYSSLKNARTHFKSTIAFDQTVLLLVRRLWDDVIAVIEHYRQIDRKYQHRLDQ